MLQRIRPLTAQTRSYCTLHRFDNNQWRPAKGGESLRIGDHEQLKKDTDEMFDIVLQRILDETKHLYQLIRSLRNNH